MTRILVADADHDCRQRYQQFFLYHGCDVQTAMDGLECLARLRRSLPDLLVLDLHMPWGGGDGVIGLMREDARLARTPVVLTAAAVSSEECDRLIAPPVVQVLTKPFSPSAFLPSMARATSPETRRWTRERLDRIEADVRGDLNGRVRDFRMSMRGNGLVLKGSSRTYYAKQLAQHAVMEAVDLPIQANEIDVV